MPLCPLCGGTGTVWFERPRHVLRCQRCTGLYAAPREHVQEEFTEAYYRGGVYSDYLADERAVRRTAAARLHRLERRVAGRTLLDVGCATGFFLEAARARAWTATGVDVSHYATDVARGRGCDVLTGSIDRVVASGRRFAAVTLWDTIEHLDHTRQTLAVAKELLLPGGVLALSTGDAGSMFARATGAHWRLLQDPTHRLFFTEPVLRRLLEQAGFRVVEVSRPGKWVSIAMILHHSGIGAAARLARWCVRARVNPMVYVNLGDVMTVISVPA